MAGLLDFLWPSTGGVNPFSSGPLGLQTFPDAVRASAFRLGIKPEDLATAISYETGGTFDPAQKGPTTKWGQHQGLIQFGEPQAKKYGVDFSRPAEDQMPAVTQYLMDTGVKPGMGLSDIYSAINAGAPGRYNASDRPGYTVAKHVASMAPHQDKAAMFLGGVEPTIQQDPSTFAQPPAPPTKEPVMADATADPISQLIAQYIAQQQGGGQSQGLLGQIFPALNNTRAGGLLNNPDLQDKLTSIGAGLASGRGWGPGFGAGVAMYQNQKDRRRDREADQTGQLLQLLMLGNTLRHQKTQEDLARFNAMPEAYKEQLGVPGGEMPASTPVAPNAVAPVAEAPSVAPQPAVLSPMEYAAEKARQTSVAQETGKTEASTAVRKKVGEDVMGMSRSLRAKISGLGKEPFEEATGPFVSEFSEGSPSYNPLRWGYEALNAPKAKQSLKEIKAYATAINTTIQRAQLKDQGAVTEWERKELNKILGDIAAARSFEEANALLNNFEALAGQMFGAAPSDGVIDAKDFFGGE